MGEYYFRTTTIQAEGEVSSRLRFTMFIVTYLTKCAQDTLDRFLALPCDSEKSRVVAQSQTPRHLKTVSSS